MTLNHTDYRRKLLGHLDRIQALKADRIEPPINVEIDLSMRCNLGCFGCHFAHTHSKGPLAQYRTVETGDLMDMGLASDIISQLSDFDVRSITWTGGGEPTLHPQLDDCVNVARQHCIDQGIYTNATRIDTRLANILSDCCEWIYVSLDAADRDTYAKEKGVDQFDRAIRGTRLLVEAGATVGLGFLLHEGNAHFDDKTDEMIALGKRLGVSYLQFRPTILFDPANPASRARSHHWMENTAILSYLSEQDHGIPIEIDVKRFLYYARWFGHSYSKCHWSGLQSVITADGRVWTCANKRGLESDCLGDLKKERFTDIWSRRPIAEVNDQCRAMCRGHMPNLVLHEIMSPKTDSNFV